MTNPALTRPTDYTLGRVVIAADRYHSDLTGNRPHVVIDTKPGFVYVAELSHTRQGRWVTTELPTRTHPYSYLALVDFRTGDWLPRWVPTTAVTAYRRQLNADTAAAAVAYVTDTYRRR